MSHHDTAPMHVSPALLLPEQQAEPAQKVHEEKKKDSILRCFAAGTGRYDVATSDQANLH